MDFIKQIFDAHTDSIIIGLVMIIAGIIVPVFKFYWLIAGINTTSKKDLEKIDLKYVGKFFGIFISIFGLVLILIPFVLTYFKLGNYIPIVSVITVFTFVSFMFIFGQIKKKRIYKQNK
jgi:hypothetical protein